MSFYVRGGHNASARKCKTLSDANELADAMSLAISDKKIVPPSTHTLRIVLPIEILTEGEWKDAVSC